jgi:hypothetical protein
MKLSLTKTVAVLIATLGLAAAAQAQNVVVRSLDAAEAAKARAAIEASMKAAARGQRVGMVTGTVNPKPQVSRSGTVSQELDATTLMFSVARINADGTVETSCLSSLESAEQAMTAPAFAKRISLSSKEQFNVTK